jgi:aryl sulfotransferase
MAQSQSNLKADMAGEIRRIADFLDIEIDETRWPAIIEHCSFDWREVLSADEIEKYERTARENLTAECAHWLATGEISS